MNDKLGATGKFPDGKINKYDEGELRIGIAIKDSNVIIEFGKPVKWIGLPGDEAIALGKLLIKKGESTL